MSVLLNPRSGTGPIGQCIFLRCLKAGHLSCFSWCQRIWQRTMTSWKTLFWSGIYCLLMDLRDTFVLPSPRLETRTFMRHLYGDHFRLSNTFVSRNYTLGKSCDFLTLSFLWFMVEIMWVMIPSAGTHWMTNSANLSCQLTNWHYCVSVVFVTQRFFVS